MDAKKLILMSQMPQKFGLPARGLVSLIVPGWTYSRVSTTAQALDDWSGKGNSFTMGATTSVGADDPTLSASGVTFGVDDFLKRAKGAPFDNLPGLTLITAFSVASAGGGSAGRIFDKGNRMFLFSAANKLQFSQIRTGSDTWLGSTVFSYPQTVIAGVKYSGVTPDNGPVIYVGTVKETLAHSSTGTGALASDAAYDLYVGNSSAAIRNLDGTIYAQAWYNRVLSDAEYRQAYKGMQRLCANLGVTI